MIAGLAVALLFSYLLTKPLPSAGSLTAPSPRPDLLDRPHRPQGMTGVTIELELRRPRARISRARARLIAPSAACSQRLLACSSLRNSEDESDIRKTLVSRLRGAHSELSRKHAKTR